MRLTYDEAVAWAYGHSGHFTDGPVRSMLLEMGETSVPELRTRQWTTPHGDQATVSYDAGQGFYYTRLVSAGALASQARFEAMFAHAPRVDTRTPADVSYSGKPRS